ncbi:hypothetical protein Calkr_1730 [Caldicellulosiruptor acetigenus I77R1B]|uniref:DUF2281 domain-containing protein n=1 Tax=Caldicellulosiruptor acetigenus (strain ATCC 700853 / DSM 12137 / I77R1B) TaxID=632335 RepID=E4SAJ4_CALA7|nr:hypothetical protein [Caldicellulosiruptor acetigenus]ADQ41219.1 hypothetical protein Calkr_1730 [Caldicellulosiruptor acetigenus I77R1B]
MRKKIIDALEELLEEKIAEIIDFVEYLKIKEIKNKENKETYEWLSHDAEWPEYEWGEKGLPECKKVKFISEIGLLIKEA